MSSYLYTNRHDLNRVTERDTEPCWRIAHLEELSARLTPEQRAQWEGVRNSDYDNGLIHDESCHTCHGTGVQPTTITVGYSCMGCGMQGDHELFETSSCLGFGAGHFEELRAIHEMGEHDGLSYRDCPLCITEKMLQRTS